jgi:hypothetical protein
MALKSGQRMSLKKCSLSARMVKLDPATARGFVAPWQRLSASVARSRTWSKWACETSDRLEGELLLER